MLSGNYRLKSWNQLFTYRNFIFNKNIRNFLFSEFFQLDITHPNKKTDPDFDIRKHFIKCILTIFLVPLKKADPNNDAVIITIKGISGPNNSENTAQKVFKEF